MYKYRLQSFLEHQSPADKAQKFRKFFERCLIFVYTTYFRWVHFEEVLSDHEVVASTNSSEGLNSTLNDGIRYSENLAHQISIVKEFKTRQIERFFEITSNRYWVPGRRPKTIERHEKLNSLVSEFINLGVVNQHDMLIETASAIGRIMSKTRK